jgi:hypothetical protein
MSIQTLIYIYRIIIRIVLFLRPVMFIFRLFLLLLLISSLI